MITMRLSLPIMVRQALPALALALAACASAPPALDKGEFDNAPDGTSITIKLGGEVMVKLDTNLTTGYQWIAAAAAGPVLAPIGNPIYVNKGNEPRFVGAGGINIFRFKGEQAGQVSLQFDHKRPWEANAAPAKSVRYTVIVAR